MNGLSATSASQQALQGIQSGLQRFSENSAQILNPNLTPEQHTNGIDQPKTKDLAGNLIDNNQIVTQVQSLSKVLKTEESLLGQLFDRWV